MWTHGRAGWRAHSRAWATVDRHRESSCRAAPDPTTRTFRVEIEVPNPDLTLRDGQTAEIVIASEGTSAHLLPQSALTLNDEGTLGVRTVIEENTVSFMPVTILRDTPNGIWLAGLPKEASVIVIGQEYVTDGVTVDPTYREIGQ